MTHTADAVAQVLAKPTVSASSCDCSVDNVTTSLNKNAHVTSTPVTDLTRHKHNEHNHGEQLQAVRGKSLTAKVQTAQAESAAPDHALG